MDTTGYNDNQMAQESVSASSAGKRPWGLGRLGYVLAVNAGLTAVSFMLMVALSNP